MIMFLSEVQVKIKVDVVPWYRSCAPLHKTFHREEFSSKIQRFSSKMCTCMIKTCMYTTGTKEGISVVNNTVKIHSKISLRMVLPIVSNNSPCSMLASYLERWCHSLAWHSPVLFRNPTLENWWPISTRTVFRPVHVNLFNSLTCQGRKMAPHTTHKGHTAQFSLAC